MGDEKEDSEGIASKLVKAPLRFLYNRTPVILAAGAICAAYVFAKGGCDSRIEFSDDPNRYWNILRNIGIILPSAVLAALGGVYLTNRGRRKRGKKPINTLNLIKGMVFPSYYGNDMEGILRLMEDYPDSSEVHFALGQGYFEEGKFIEAMESYFAAIRLRENEWMVKIPILGTFQYSKAERRLIRKYEKQLEKDPTNLNALLNLALKYFFVNDFERAIECFEKVDKERDPVALHILASRLYSEISRRADRPKSRAFSFGDSCVGRAIDSVVYFWDRKRPDSLEMKWKSDEEAKAAVEKILERDDLEDHLERIGEYSVYKIGLNSFVRGFIVLKEEKKKAPCAFEREMEHERIFERRVAGAWMKAMHPISIVNRKGNRYLVLLCENGRPCAESRNPAHFRTAMEFAARSDALMPTHMVANPVYEPEQHFKKRLEEMDDRIRQKIGENSDFLFKHSKAFPVVFDGDWHAFNYLFDLDGFIIALDKEGKGVSIGPVTAARAAYQYVSLPGNPRMTDMARDEWIEDVYIPTYNRFADKKLDREGVDLFLPYTMAKVIEKAVTAYVFNRGKPSMKRHVDVTLHNAVHAGQRIRDKFRDYYSEAEVKQCRNIERIIQTELLS